MLLTNKMAVLFGAAGSLGSTIARAFAREGARLFLSGRHLDNVQQLADTINGSGGRAEAQEVDALDEKAVSRYIEGVVQAAGRIDIVFNAIALDPLQGIPLTDMSLKDFSRPVQIATETQFITGVTVARVMQKQRSGVILSLTATPGGIGYPHVGGFGPACCVMESLSRNLASELGPYGIRVVNMRSGGSPDSRVFAEATKNQPEVMKTVLQKLQDDTMLKKQPPMADIANLAVFLCSDLAASITGVTVDTTAGTTAALNYRTMPIPLR